MTYKYRPFAASGTPAAVDAALALHMTEPTGAHIGRIAEYAGPFAWSTVQLRGLFECERLARNAIDAYYVSWPPMGYGTSLTLRVIGPDLVAVQGSRMASCD